MSTELKEKTRKALVAQTSEVLVKKLMNDQLMGISKEIAIEILESRKEKGSFKGEIPVTVTAKGLLTEEKVKKEKVVKEPRVKKEKVDKIAKEAKTFNINGVVHTTGDKVKFEAANNHPLKGEKIIGTLISIHYNEENKINWVRSVSTVDDKKYYFWKKYDSVSFS